jgi:GAF domain-containing protein
MMAGAAPGAAAAVAVPLVTSAGCNGVLSAEIRDTKPAPELLALARIVAAQFATLIGPAEYNSARAAEA